jgi:hypothetical protein
MSKKILLSLREELYAILEKEAKSNYMKMQDLIYFILINHVKNKNPKNKINFEDVFSK